MTKVVAFVPIKLSNQRLQNKNILPLGGKPLCWHIFAQLLILKKNKKIDDIYVYCSDHSIMNFLPYGIKFIQRSQSLDNDTTKGLEIYNAFMNDVCADVYVLCHATSPFLQSKTIENGIDAVISGNYDSAFTAQKAQTFCWYEGKPLNYSLTDIPRTQDIQPVFIETSAMFVYEKNVMLQNRRIGERSKTIITSPIESVDIDYKEDYDLACCIATSMHNLLISG